MKFNFKIQQYQADERYVTDLVEIQFRTECIWFNRGFR